MSCDHYTIVTGMGDQVTTGVQAHELDRVAQACANRLGCAVWAHGEEDERGTRYDPAVSVEAHSPVVSDCLAGGIDVDVTVTIGEDEVVGEVTLCRDRSGDWTSYGDAADCWVSGGLLGELMRRCADERDTNALRDVLGAIRVAALAEVTEEVAEQADAVRA